MQASMTKPCVAMAGAQIKMPARPAPKQSTLKIMKNKVSNAPSYKQMLVWEPEDNKQFETFSYLPPLTDDQISKQIDYIIGQKWIPCLEFSNPEYAYVKDIYPIRFCGTSSTYYDNRYWTMWKLPMFGCQDPAQVLREIQEAAATFPKAYVRLLGFDSNRQVQVLSFLVHRPPGEKTYTPLPERSRGAGQ